MPNAESGTPSVKPGPRWAGAIALAGVLTTLALAGCASSAGRPAIEASGGEHERAGAAASGADPAPDCNRGPDSGDAAESDRAAGFDRPDDSRRDARGAPGTDPDARDGSGDVRSAVLRGVASSRPDVIYDATVARPVPARDFLERITKQRGLDFILIDRIFDPGTQPPPFERRPLAPAPPGTLIAAGIRVLDDVDPFPAPPPLWDKEVTIHVGLARSTYKTREPEEVLSAAQPFIDLTQRQVNVRGAPVLHESPDELFYALAEGREQMAIAHVFDYLLVRSWCENVPDGGAILLGWSQPARPRVTDLDRDQPGPAGTSIELIVAADAPVQTFADLRGRRLALAAHDTRGPGAFLTRLLRDAGQPREQPFFSSVTLRRYPKDALIDVMRGKADAACLDQGTVAAGSRFWGLGRQLRTLAVSPRYNHDVLFSSVNNLATHRTEIELTQQQLNTLAKDPEGQEVLFFFDLEGWRFYREGDIDVARAHFADFVRFLYETPVDLAPLLDPNAPIDRRTYSRTGDE